MVYETPDEQLRSAKRALAVQRDGGTHRSGPRSIGKGSAQLKAKALLKRTMLFGAALLAILTAASVAGMVLNQSEYGHQALSDIIPVRDLFGLLFFASVGMLLDPAFLGNPVPAR